MSATPELDASVRPQDDLFAHVANPWLAQHPIPADKGRFGAYDLLQEAAEQQVRTIIEAQAETAPQPGSVAAQVGDLYASFMDLSVVDAAGTDPIADELAAIDAVTDVSGLCRQLGALGRTGVGGLVLPFVSTDDRDPDRYVVYLEQGGLGLPDESYYRQEQHAELRAGYVDHLERMLSLLGLPDARARAEAVMALESALAAGHWDSVATRDPVKTYTLVDRAGLVELSPGLDWQGWLAGLGAPAGALDAVVVRQPSFVTAAAALLGATARDHAGQTGVTDLGVWRDWLRWHLVHARAPYLSAAFVDENFDFYGRALSGVPTIRQRWKRGVALVEAALGEGVGQLYVDKHFPPAAKEAMTELVADLVQAFRRSLSTVPWLGEQTRQQALAKLEAFTAKIGYPDTWRDYSGLRIDADDLVGNVRRAAAFETDRHLAKLGGPVDRAEWFITPQTVNAYYNPGMNEIVFPAAILQPPFFDLGADDAFNYGGIGAVIGHEIGHGFDDAGSRFDGAGALVDWWTPQDRERFDALAQALIVQFGALSGRDAPGESVNGALTVGENIGDLGGLAIGLSAYRISLGDQPAPVIDGLTGDQRFFLGWARIWAGSAREAEARRLLTIDPHSPLDLRANAVRNLDEFHEAFDVRPGDGMWLEPGDRVRIF